MTIQDENDRLLAPSKEFNASMSHTFKAVVTEKKKLVLFALLTIVAGIAQTVYIVSSIHATGPFFVFWSTIPIFLLCFGGIYGYQWFSGNLTAENTVVSQKAMFINGFLTFANGVCILFANPYVPGVLQAILGPTVLTTPMVMGLSFFFLGRRYDIGRLVSVVVIIIGVGFASYPSFAGDDITDAPTNAIPTWIWTALFMIGSLPAAISAVYEEKIFDSGNVAPAPIMWWITVWQSVCIFTMGAGLDMVPAFGTAGSPKDFWAEQKACLLCTFGEDTSVWQYVKLKKNETPPPDAKFNDKGEVYKCMERCKCSGGKTLFVWLMMAFGFSGQSLGSLGVIKYGSATFAQIVTTIITPLSAIAFAVPFLAWPYDPDEVKWPTIVALILILAGMLAYTYFDNRERTKEEMTEKTLD